MVVRRRWSAFGPMIVGWGIIESDLTLSRSQDEDHQL
jgi:hypothetical protein